ncbi:MAG: hypothetical protein H6741_31790 [Alphaproteobacteria bacterium]|nr:hypothetical protein [Alphaproteobacteria bacterium]
MSDKFFGKYRGRVRANLDPLQLGRIQVEVPAFPGVQMAWALPCVPYAGKKVGFLSLPPVGAMVWVEFEGGDLNFPIWTGCFWEAGQMPVSPVIPATRFFVTECISLVMKDTQGAGGITLEVKPPAVRTAVKIVLDSSGALLEVQPSKARLTTREIEATVPAGKLLISGKAASLEVGPTKLEMSSKDIKLTAPPAKLNLSASSIKAELASSSLEVAAAQVEAKSAASAFKLMAAMIEAKSGASSQKIMTSGNIMMDASGASVMMGQGMVNVNKGALQVI